MSAVQNQIFDMRMESQYWLPEQMLPSSEISWHDCSPKMLRSIKTAWIVFSKRTAILIGTAGDLKVTFVALAETPSS